MFIRQSLISLCTLLLLTACDQSPAPADETNSVAVIRQAELIERMEKGTAPVILDVRSPDEYAEGHIPAAINIPHAEVAARIDELGLDKSAEIVVHCFSGKRAGMAETDLQADGYSNVIMLEGHWQAWASAGMPIEK